MARNPNIDTGSTEWCRLSVKNQEGLGHEYRLQKPAGAAITGATHSVTLMSGRYDASVGSVRTIRALHSVSTG